MIASSFIKILGISILYSVCSNSLGAQNFVPDSSFEYNKSIPTDFSGIGSSKTWDRASWGTTDLFCECDRKSKKYSMVDVPMNSMGNQEAHSGTCYAGIFALSHGSYREYLQTPLNASLEKNKYYLFSMYVSLADYSPATIDQLGVCFLYDKAAYNSPNVITNLKPSYIKIDTEVGKDIGDWHKVTIIYKASGGEKVILIGSFEIKKIGKTKLKMPKDIKTRLNQAKGRDAYYFIDDVSLVQTDFVEPIDTAKGFDITEKALVDTSFIFKNVLFPTNKSALLPSSYTELNQLTDYLEKNPEMKIEIIGHTDDSGNEKTNKKLSIYRAESVSVYLISKGIDKKRVTHNGYGSMKPLASNKTKEGRQANRRVEFKLSMD